VFALLAFLLKTWKYYPVWLADADLRVQKLQFKNYKYMPHNNSIRMKNEWSGWDAAVKNRIHNRRNKKREIWLILTMWSTLWEIAFIFTSFFAIGVPILY